MSISMIFFRDFYNKERVKKIIILLTLMPVLFSMMLKDLNISDAYAGLVGITIAFASTIYALSSYATLDKLKLYLSLPIESNKFIWSLVFVLYFDVLVEKLSVFVIAALFIYSNPIPIILSSILTSFICVITVVALLLTMNANKKIGFICNIFSVLGIICTSIFMPNERLYWIVSNICLSAIPIITLMSFSNIDIVIVRQLKQIKYFRFINKNYFTLTMIAEKIYVANTLVIIAVILAFLALSPTEDVILNLAWCMGAINTPAMSMLSGDKWIAKQTDMLPNRKQSIMMMYLKFLAGYFILINIIILGFICFKAGNLSALNVIVLLIVTAIEVSATLMLEKNGG